MRRSAATLAKLIAPILVITGVARAQHFPIARWTETAWPSNKTVGPHTNRTNARQIVDTVIEEIQVSSIMRLKFASWNLPTGTFIQITSPRSGEIATMDDATLRGWSGFTPMFNDDTLIVDLVANPGAGPASFVIASANSVRADQVPLPGAGGFMDDICGTDNRTRSNATAVGRLWIGGGLCTASLVATGDVAVSAGHCGAPAAGDELEFDPPDSVFNPQTMSWFVVVGPVANQFPVNANRVFRNFTFTLGPCNPPNQNQTCIFSYGEDALAFGLNANTNGQTAGLRRGDYLRISRVPQVSTNFTATKWGNGTTTPAGANHLTMKFLSGTIDGDRVNLDGGNFWLFSFDTTGGDSGGPIINQNVNASVGVTSWSAIGNCDSGAYAFSDPAFRTVIENAVNQATTRFVDYRSTTIAGESVGTIWNPSTTFRANAYNVVTAGGTVNVAPGTYSADSVLSRPATIRAPFGMVTLNP